MAISATPHVERSIEDGAPIDVLGPQMLDAIAVADGTVSGPIVLPGLYRIIATSACTVRLGKGLADASGGEFWPEGHMEVRMLVWGDEIAVDALA